MRRGCRDCSSCTTRSDSPASSAGVDRHFRTPFGGSGASAATRHQVPGSRLHDLRHTWATLALAAGVPAKIVAERLGQRSMRVTLDIYSHVTPTMGRDAAAQVAGLIFGS